MRSIEILCRRRALSKCFNRFNSNRGGRIKWVALRRIPIGSLLYLTKKKQLFWKHFCFCSGGNFFCTKLTTYVNEKGMELKIIHTFGERKNSIWETAQTLLTCFCKRFGEANNDFQIGGGMSKISSGVERKLVIINISITCLRKNARPKRLPIIRH